MTQHAVKSISNIDHQSGVGFGLVDLFFNIPKHARQLLQGFFDPIYVIVHDELTLVF